MILKEIPEIFFSSKTNLPFENCIICNKKLANQKVDYFVLKSYRYYKEYDKKDVIYEMALCFKCAEMLEESYSDESNERIEKYFADNFNLKNMLKLISSNNYNIYDWIAHCACKGMHWKETNSFHIYGIFESSKIIYFKYGPYMLSDEVMADIAYLISNQTIDSLRSLFDIYTVFPPEFRSIFSKSLIKN